MEPKDQMEYAEIICLSFNEVEIENLEIYANHMFDMVERGVPITMNYSLILETLEDYGEEGGEDE